MPGLCLDCVVGAAAPGPVIIPFSASYHRCEFQKQPVPENNSKTALRWVYTVTNVEWCLCWNVARSHSFIRRNDVRGLSVWRDQPKKEYSVTTAKRWNQELLRLCTDRSPQPWTAGGPRSFAERLLGRYCVLRAVRHDSPSACQVFHKRENPRHLCSWLCLSHHKLES